MIAGQPAAWRYVLIVLLFGSYAALVHHSNSNANSKPIGVLLAITPLAALGFGLIWRAGHRLVAVGVTLILGAIVFSRWRVLESRYSLLYLLEDAALYGLLSLTFARSLTRGRTPLCTYWASSVHGALPPVLARYTRKVTAAWAVLFMAIVAGSIALYAWAPLSVWSAFANFITPLLIVLMFLCEYALRHKVLPPSHRTGLLRSVRAFLEAPRTDRVLRP